jgi:hypothetical protein
MEKTTAKFTVYGRDFGSQVERDEWIDQNAPQRRAMVFPGMFKLGRGRGFMSIRGNGVRIDIKTGTAVPKGFTEVTVN